LRRAGACEEISLIRPDRSRSRWRPALFGALALAASLLAPAAQAQGLIRDTEVEETLRAFSDPLLVAAGLEPKDVEIILIADKSLNAFATSGQIMGLHTGTIIEADTPNQLKGVIAHEIGHIAGGHPIRSGEMGRAGMRPFLLTLGLGVLAAIAGAPDAGAALLGSSGYFGTLGALKFSREQEGRADQAAATYLEATGQSGRGLVDFFENFRYQEVFSEARRFPYFVSHPLSGDRIQGLRRRVEEASNYDATDSQEDLARLAVTKAKLEAFLNAPQQTFAQYKESDSGYPARYARAIAYYRATDTEKALKALDVLLVEQPNNPYLWELKGQVLFESGRAAEAEAPHRRSVELKPEAPLLRINLAQAMLAQTEGRRDLARIDAAEAELRKALALEDDNSFAWRLMAQAHDARGEPGLARLASAEAHYVLGDLPQAKVFAMRAREQLDAATPSWRRATDIVLASKPTDDDLKTIARDTGGRGG
jgi:predicted Zn-dependent protease